MKIAGRGRLAVIGGVVQVHRHLPEPGRVLRPDGPSPETSHHQERENIISESCFWECHFRKAFWGFLSTLFDTCFICRPTDSTVSKIAWIES
jgi:hypothetical protein